MTPLEIAGVVLLSILSAHLLLWLFVKIASMIKIQRVEKSMKEQLNAIFKDIDNDIKELKRQQFFEDLERIKNENKEEKE